MTDATKCRICGEPHGLTEFDAGEDREVERMCCRCFRAWCYGMSEAGLRDVPTFINKKEKA